MISRALLFWSAFILTRPLGATLGDLLDKPLADGGLEIDRLYASAVLAALMIACILLFEQRPGRHHGAHRAKSLNTLDVRSGESNEGEQAWLVVFQ